MPPLARDASVHRVYPSTTHPAQIETPAANLRLRNREERQGGQSFVVFVAVVPRGLSLTLSNTDILYEGLVGWGLITRHFWVLRGCVAEATRAALPCPAPRSNQRVANEEAFHLAALGGVLICCYKQ